MRWNSRRTVTVSSTCWWETCFWTAVKLCQPLIIVTSSCWNFPKHISSNGSTAFFHSKIFCLHCICIVRWIVWIQIIIFCLVSRLGFLFLLMHITNQHLFAHHHMHTRNLQPLQAHLGQAIFPQRKDTKRLLRHYRYRTDCHYNKTWS